MRMAQPSEEFSHQVHNGHKEIEGLIFYYFVSFDSLSPVRSPSRAARLSDSAPAGRIALVVRELRFPIFLGLKAFAGHAFRFIGSEKKKYVGYVSGICPFRRIFLRLSGSLHRCVPATPTLPPYTTLFLSCPRC